jgi:hypothetical protein
MCKRGKANTDGNVTFATVGSKITESGDMLLTTSGEKNSILTRIEGSVGPGIVTIAVEADALTVGGG